jgi:hypothetical protein
MRSQTALVHLKPEPNATCITRCPFFMGLLFCVCSAYASSYQMEEEDVLP